MGPALWLIGSSIALLAASSYVAGLVCSQRGQDAWESCGQRLRRLLRLTPPPLATHRPLEEVAADVRRRHIRFHSLPLGSSFVRVEAARVAYEKTLAECCALLGHEHLLSVLSPGPDLDRERERVEDLLSDSGLAPSPYR